MFGAGEVVSSGLVELWVLNFKMVGRYALYAKASRIEMN